jgi:hypothetical protein
MSIRLTLYSRAYCQLCHDMHAALETLQPVHGFSLEVVDVDQDETLETRYGARCRCWRMSMAGKFAIPSRRGRPLQDMSVNA